ncbi:aldehyde dehydrogenase family protein [Streptomyces sp. NPDC002790]|uniref:aldehyde dehydrogenase family protein n=1 Tax=Streptomyces sp. NPDC002790 TaxID=3154431 RepID=UPI00331F13AF
MIVTMASQQTAGADRQFDLRIGSSFEPGRGEPIPVYNPATEELIAEVGSADAEQVRRAVQAARGAFDRGELGSPEERSACLRRLADVLEAHTDDILASLVAEVGTPVSTARGLHVGTPVRILRWLAEATLKDRTEYLGREPGPPDNEAMVLYRPVGVVAGIAAYNYPLVFAAMKIGSAFAAGCPSVLLSSPNSPLTLLRFGRWLDEAGFPPDAVSVLAGGVETAQELIRRPEVAKVSFTGSVPAGTAVMKSAAEGLRGVVLELGGKSAAIVLPSVDPAAVVADLHSRYLRNAGQGCASPTRILVHRSRMDAFVEASRKFYGKVAVGDPQDPATLVGPVISKQHRARVQGFIDTALKDGGHLLAQGPLPDSDRGWYVRPTLIGGLSNDAEINQEEIFGPVATVQSYDDVDEAVALANASKFGLHASVFGPHDEAMGLAPRLEAGLVTFNGGAPVRTDAPNGGWKASGIGRERGEAGIREFLEPVTVQWPVNA